MANFLKEPEREIPRRPSYVSTREGERGAVIVDETRKIFQEVKLN